MGESAFSLDTESLAEFALDKKAGGGAGDIVVGESTWLPFCLESDFRIFQRQKLSQ